MTYLKTLLSKTTLSILFTLLLLASFSQLTAQDARVLVSIAPYLEIVEKLAGNKIQVEVILPQGADAHDYEPTPKQIQRYAESQVWFMLGECFEKRMQTALQSQNPNLVVCDLRTDIPLIKEVHPQHIGGYDPHIWMSPRLMILQAKTIAETLEQAFPSPEMKEAIQNNLVKLINELEALDNEIHEQFEELHKTHSKIIVLVAHPAYSYFCREYGITQLSIEQEGKDPSAKELTHLLQETKKLQIKTIFIQGPYPHKGAQLIAKEIGANLVTLNPNSAHYFQMMRQIAKEFAEATPKAILETNP